MRIVLTGIVAAVLAVVATFGVYSAGKPAAQQITSPIVNYGSN